MEEETIRTLITATSSSVAILATVFFGFVTHTRKERIEKLEKELRESYGQFRTLYRVEKELLRRLECSGSTNATELKKEVRKSIHENGNEYLTLTDTEVNKRLQKL